MSALTSSRKSFSSRFRDNFFDRSHFNPKLWDFDNDILDVDFPVVPSVNIVENSKDYKIEVAAPGLDKNDFKVEVENGVLTISAEKREETREEKENYSRREFSYNRFSRSFNLPENSLADKFEAKYENGILLLKLPKVAVTNKLPTKVQVA